MDSARLDEADPQLPVMVPMQSRSADPRCVAETAEEQGEEQQQQGKRTSYLPWEDYFMLLAGLAKERSKDPRTQVGCVVVDDKKRILGTGYNGFPVGCSDDVLPWASESPRGPECTKYPYVVHAEVNAVLNSARSPDLTGCTLYVTQHPCNECAKVIIQSRVSRIVYHREPNFEKPEYSAAKTLFRQASIPVTKYKGTTKFQVVI